MGYYINPKDRTKEQWLRENGEEVPPMLAKELAAANGSHMPVVLVDNGYFTAAGIVYNVDELMAFTGPDDPRPKTFYSVPREKLQPFCNLL